MEPGTFNHANVSPYKPRRGASAAAAAAAATADSLDSHSERTLLDSPVLGSVESDSVNFPEQRKATVSTTRSHPSPAVARETTGQELLGVSPKERFELIELIYKDLIEFVFGPLPKHLAKTNPDLRKFLRERLATEQVKELLLWLRHTRFHDPEHRNKVLAELKQLDYLDNESARVQTRVQSEMSLAVPVIAIPSEAAKTTTTAVEEEISETTAAEEVTREPLHAAARPRASAAAPTVSPPYSPRRKSKPGAYLPPRRFYP